MDGQNPDYIQLGCEKTKNNGGGNCITFVEGVDRNGDVKVYALHTVKQLMSLADPEVDGILVLISDDEMEDLKEEGIEERDAGIKLATPERKEDEHGIPPVLSKDLETAKSKELEEESKMMAKILLICSLCLGKIAGKTNVCAHLFCQNCILQAVFEQEKCPICETKITFDKL